MEDWVTIKTLKKRRPDLGTRKIAELLGISRNTVKRALQSETGPEYKRESKPNPEIEPFTDYIYHQIVVKRLKGSRVLNDIRSKGYRGSQSAFYRYLSKIKQPVKKTFQPYETGPGEQAQFDWSPYTVTIGDELTKVYVYNYILGFSRHRIYEASLSETQGSVFEALENSIQEMEGVPQRLQTDNARCFVTNSSKENFQWNRRYLQFCGHYGFKPTRSLPGHPWSKGKVEHPFSYLETHFIQDNTFANFPDFVKRLKLFQDQVNTKVHSTTHQEPQILFESEKSSLAILPKTRYVDVKEQVRKVTADCLFSFQGNRYSVPWQFALREVWIKISKGYFVEVYSSQNAIIAVHRLSTGKGRVVINQNHYKAHRIEKGNWKRLCDTFLNRFPDHQWFLDRLEAQKRINPAYHLTQILDTAEFYSIENMKQALYACRHYNVFTSVFVKGFLENHGQLQLESLHSMDQNRNGKPSNEGHLSKSVTGKSVKRSLSDYQLILHFQSEKEVAP